MWLAVTLLALVSAGTGVVGQPAFPTPTIVVKGDNPKAVEAVEGFLVDYLLATVNSDRDNYVTQEEVRDFFQSLDTNRNGNVDRCELQNRYVRDFNVSSTAASFLYNVINSHDNDINGTVRFTFDEIVLGNETGGEDRVSLKDARNVLINEIYLATDLATRHKDVIIADPMTPLPLSGEDVARILDADKDGLVSVNEMTAQIADFDTDGDDAISRCEFQTREEALGRDSTAASLLFYHLDNDGDGFLSMSEIIADLLAADSVVADQKITIDEYAKYLDRNQLFARRQAGVPVRLLNYTCEWMDRHLPLHRPAFDVMLWVTDADANVDGEITQQEYHDVVDKYLKKNNIGKSSRCGFQTRAGDRYRVSRSQANAIYDALDANRDDKVTPEDLDVTVADYNQDGKTTTCELLLYMTFLTSKAEERAEHRAKELARKRELLFEHAVLRQQGKLFNVDPNAALNAYIRGDRCMDDQTEPDKRGVLFEFFQKWMQNKKK